MMCIEQNSRCALYNHGRGKGKEESKRITVKTFPCFPLSARVSPLSCLPCQTGSVPVSLFLYLLRLFLPHPHPFSFCSVPLLVSFFFSIRGGLAVREKEMSRAENVGHLLLFFFCSSSSRRRTSTDEETVHGDNIFHSPSTLNEARLKGGGGGSLCSLHPSSTASYPRPPCRHFVSAHLADWQLRTQRLRSCSPCLQSHERMHAGARGGKTAHSAALEVPYVTARRRHSGFDHKNVMSVTTGRINYLYLKVP